MTSEAIRTSSLSLVPHTVPQSLALVRSFDEYRSLASFPVDDGLRSFFGTGDISPEFAARLDAPHSAWLHGFAIVHVADNRIVGMCGFKGSPNDAGEVEIAYGISPAYQGRGLATEAAAALAGFAFEDSRVNAVAAHTLPEQNASTQVLTKCGFVFVGEVVDPEDGPVWRWELTRDSPAGAHANSR